MTQEGGGEGPFDSGAYSRLQQQLVAVRARLDRQVGQLMRLNRVSDQLLDARRQRPVAEEFAEVIVDVLDVAVGAAWVFGEDATQLAVFGMPAPPDSWVAAGGSIADGLRAAGARRAVNLASQWHEQLPGANLVDPIVCLCLGAQDRVRALILASNTDRMAGMFEPTADETLEILSLIAEKLALHCDADDDRRFIEQQVALVRESEQRLALVLKGTNDGWWDWDVDANSCFVSERWLQMLGLSGHNGQVLSGFWNDRVHPDDRDAFERLLKQSLAGSAEGLETELRLGHVSGTYLPVLVRGTITREPDGAPVRFTGSILDLTERQKQEQQVRRLAFYDPLTELPNRRLLVSRLDEALRLNSQSATVAAVLMLDLDRFKVLNDTHGHAAGDQLLKEVAARLQQAVRGSDTVARLSGDEFIALLPNAGQDEPTAILTAQRVAERIQRSFSIPFELDSGAIYHSASIGIAVAASGAGTVESVLQHADVAMYAAKAAGRNTVRVFEQQMQTQIEEGSRFEARLRQAFQRQEFAVHYQPQVDNQGQLQGLEALLRWLPEDDAAVPIDEVIATAEESGLIHDLGLWILRTACLQAAAWGVGASARIAVNLSSAEFLHPEFPERVLAVLAETGVPGQAIRLEITEATVVSDLEFAAGRMDMLRSHGIEFSLDDFGTGYSSLTYLRRLPLSEVKIDKSFVRNFPQDPQDVAIVEAVVALCSTLDLRVIAEGVETREQFDALREYGCDYFQGYLLGTPQPPSERPEDLVIPLLGPR